MVRVRSMVQWAGAAIFMRRIFSAGGAEKNL